LMGTTMVLCGFAGVLVGSPTAPPLAQAVICLGAAATTYKHAVMAKKELANIAMRHVEKVVLLPKPGSADAGADASADASADAPASEHTAQDRVEATREMELLVRTPNMDMTFQIGQPVTAWEGAKYTGLVADERPAFSNVCTSLLSFEEVFGATVHGDPPKIPDRELLEALLDSDKVIVERKVTLREDLEPDHLLACPADTPKRMEGLLDGVGSKEPGSAETNQQAAGKRRHPATEIQFIGRQSIFSGFIFQMAGLAFISRLFTEGEDPTLGDMYAKWKTGDANAKRERSG